MPRDVMPVMTDRDLSRQMNSPVSAIGTPPEILQPLPEQIPDRLPESPSPMRAGPMDYLRPSLDPVQGQALGSLGTPTVIETAAATIGAENENLIAQIKEDETAGAGGWYQGYYDQITLPTSTMEGANLDQVTRHELLHRLVQQLQDSGVLENMPLPEMQSILEKFDSFTGDASVQDFINFVQMNDPRNLAMVPATEGQGSWYDYLAEKGGRRFDPRMRTAGWDYADTPVSMSSVGVEDDPELLNYNIDSGPPNFASPPWVGSSERGQQDWEDWLAYQRELPPEEYGGMVVGGEDGRTLPSGPATVNLRHVQDEEGNWKMIPVSTGALAAGGEGTPSYRAAQSYFFDPNAARSPHSQLPANVATRWNPEAGAWSYGAESNADQYMGKVQSATGLRNWPMGSEHALLAAQAAQFDRPGQQEYQAEVPNEYDNPQYYGDMARFNREAALLAHPDSRIRAIAEAGIPNIVLEKLNELLSTGGDDVWGEAGSYEGAMQYLNELMQRYQSEQL